METLSLIKVIGLRLDGGTPWWISESICQPYYDGPYYKSQYDISRESKLIRAMNIYQSPFLNYCITLADN